MSDIQNVCEDMAERYMADEYRVIESFFYKPSFTFPELCGNGCYERIKDKFTEDSDISSKDMGDGLVAASRNGHIAIVKEILNSSFLMRYYSDQVCAMIAASQGGYLEIVKLLSSSYKYDDNDLNTPLKCACENGNIDLVKYFIENGAYDFSGAKLGVRIGGYRMIKKGRGFARFREIDEFLCDKDNEELYNWPE